MATGALHQALIEQKKRTKVNIIVSTGSARDTHQIACLIAFGATSVYPWLAYQTILDLSHKKELKGDPFENCAKYRKGINKGLTIIHLNEVLPSKNKLSLNALMATGALHQALIEQRKRTKVNIIVSTGSARDTHQIACLIAFGATLSIHGSHTKQS